MRWGWLGFLVALAGCGGTCPTSELQAQLDAASDGEVVVAGACRYEGSSLSVPDGVTLRGAGEGTILASEGGVAVALGEGAALEMLEVEVVLGRGVVIDARTSAALRDVTIVGPVDAASAETIPPMPRDDETATHGLVISSSGTEAAPVELSAVRVSGFGRFGAIFVGSHVRWEAGGVADNLGTGLMAQGGTTQLRDLEITGTRRGLQTFAYGAVFTAGAIVETLGLTLRDNEGVGAIHDEASAGYTELIASGNRESALWVQRGIAFTLDASLLEDNTLSGIVLVDTDLATITATQIDRTREATTIVGHLGEVLAGDGLQAILPSATGLRLDGVTLTGNERVGLLLQIADGEIPTTSLTNVVVEAQGDALGAVAQTETATIPADAFGSGLERRGAAVTNDALAVDRLGVLGAVAPMFFPPPDP